MRRCFFLLLPALFMGAIAHTQLVNNGATITVQAGATIKCTGTIQNNSGGIIQNAGIVSSDGELRNEVGGTLANNVTEGVYEATTKFVNYGNAFTAIKLRLIGNVNTDSIKTGAGSTYDSVILAKGTGNTGTLSDAMTVNGGIRFDNDNNQLIIEDENLIMGPSANFASADANEFVVTNNTGVVTKQNLGTATTPATFTYEVGFAAGQYNPLSIANTGTTDNISVRCLQNVLDQGLTGVALTSDFANNSWVVTEAVAGGSNLQLTANWAQSDELANFNRVKTGIARYVSGTDWDMPASNVASASGSGPYSRIRNNITSVGVFAVGDLEKVNAARLTLKVFLQGAYNSGSMNDGLRSLNVIPAIQPYSSAMSPNFTRVGVYDGSVTVNEHVTSTSVFDVTGTNNDIVDWVYISLQDNTNPATKLQTKAALVQRDGDIVEYDSASAAYGPVRMPIDTNGRYHILIGHRNHLNIRTSVSQVLQNNITMPLYDFTTAQTQAYQDAAITTNAAMKDLGSGVFGMWGGNANSNNATRASGGNATLNDFLYLVNTVLGGNNALILGPPSTAAVYNNADLNMNGAVRASGGNATLNDFLFLVNTVLGGNNALIFTAHQ